MYGSPADRRRSNLYAVGDGDLLGLQIKTLRISLGHRKTNARQSAPLPFARAQVHRFPCRYQVG